MQRSLWSSRVDCTQFDFDFSVVKVKMQYFHSTFGLFTEIRFPKSREQIKWSETQNWAFVCHQIEVRFELTKEGDTRRHVRYRQWEPLGGSTCEQNEPKRNMIDERWLLEIGLRDSSTEVTRHRQLMSSALEHLKCIFAFIFLLHPLLSFPWLAPSADEMRRVTSPSGHF